MTRTVSIDSFLTKEQLNEAITIMETSQGHARHVELRDRIIGPNIHEIDRKLGQKNDMDYLAYALEHALSQAIQDINSGL